ncbi:hypothetical protein [Antiquaquibacter soli]|uniref:Acetone carboxylase n=1 Tax=Antiquaquibacter soli TaxID=3064523 RepID=A0ABT9BLR3_9MICO|nr:hypothetical protein [Protaetiibacter sp. WY-16]MDO7881943.1 hypothetical protein [Protaetiibacter sp. WY-16]
MEDEAAAHCSRAGCRADAAWSIGWRNPRIHSADRVKLWAACDEHRPFLHDYLETRGFPVVVVPAGTVIDVVPDGSRS